MENNLKEKKRSKFLIRFDLHDILCGLSDIEEIFINFIHLFLNEKFNIDLIFFYNEKENKKIEKFKNKYIDVLCNLKSYKFTNNLNDFVWYDIYNEFTSINRNNFKFKNTYTNEDEFISSVFNFISFIKATQNKDEEKYNETWYNRKQSVRKKSASKKNNLGIKKEV